jgi:hypothetical protein
MRTHSSCVQSKPAIIGLTYPLDDHLALVTWAAAQAVQREQARVSLSFYCHQTNGDTDEHANPPTHTTQ